MGKLKYLLLVAVVAMVTASCKKEEESFRLTFERTTVYFNWGDAPKSIAYSTENVKAVTLKSVSDGWQCRLDAAARMVVVTPPAKPATEDECEEMASATVTLGITSKEGESDTSQLSLRILGSTDIALDAGGAYANCYVATTPSARYSFDGKMAANGTKQITPASVRLLWQTPANLIKELDLAADGTVSFFVDRQTDKKGNDITDGSGNTLAPEGNAVIAVCDAAGAVLWSWHVWSLTEAENPLVHYDTYSSGKSYMDKNLGSFTNSNGDEDTEEIYRSYGLYYQWGRKDPFARPVSYDCAEGHSATVFDATGNTVYFRYAETEASVGTVAYAVANPMVYITNAASADKDGGSAGDWLQSADNSLWSDDGKTAYDPCPAGWRVAAKGDFDVLTLSDAEDGTDIDVARKRYGWSLSDGTGTYFYLGAGYKSYYDGLIANMNSNLNAYPSTPEPWEGYYWTSGTTGDGKALCLYFDLTTSRTVNKFNNSLATRRANGLQVRCVKL